MREILAYVKPTDYCNVGCSHCYLPLSVRNDKTVMSWDVFRKTIEVVKGMAQQSNASTINWLYHGGEPLMMSPDYYYESHEVLKQEFEGTGLNVLESVQTSLVPFGKHWIDVVKDCWGSHMGASIDFSLRQKGGSSSAFLRMLLKRYELAKENDISISFGMVPSKSELGTEREILEWFVAHDIPSFSIDRYNDYKSVDANRPSNYEHSLFLVALFRESMSRIRDGKKVPYNNVIDACIKGVLHGISADRWGGTCMSDYIVVSPTGETNNCPDKLTKDSPFSNVKNGDIAFLTSKDRMDSILSQLHGHKQAHCYSCEYSGWCKSGCPITVNDFGLEGDCSGYKHFIEHVNNFAKESSENIALLQYYIT